MFLAVLISLVLLFIISLFSSPRLSPIPYFPTNKKDLPLIIKALSLKNHQTVVDLGAGDGIVIFKAANIAYDKKISTKFVAVDINPVLVFIMHIRRFFHPNRKNIKIIWGDLFRIKLKTQMSNVKTIMIYLYVSPWLLEKIIENCKLQIENFEVVSYFYPINSLKKTEKAIKGKNNIYIYKLGI